jgi:hypothetical protein
VRNNRNASAMALRKTTAMRFIPAIFGYVSADVFGCTLDKLLPMRFRAAHADFRRGTRSRSTTSAKVSHTFLIHNKKAYTITV